MRFPRQSSIFRGPLDPAPVVGVLFLLVVFMLLGSLLYTPGVLMRFADVPSTEAHTLTVTRDNQVIFNGVTNGPEDLEKLREGELKQTPVTDPFRLEVQSGADPKFVQKVRDLFQVQLPEGDNLTSTENPTVIVAVNFRGQCFYENEPVDDKQLKLKLRQSLDQAGPGSKKLTLVLWADKATENDVIMRIYRLARGVGITDFLLAENPGVFAAPSKQARP